MKTLAVLLAAPAGTWKGSMETQAGTTPVTIRIQPGENNIGPGKVRYEGTVAGSEVTPLVTGTQDHQYRLNCKPEPVDSK